MAAPAAYAGEAAAIDKADTVWVLISTAMVMLMTPGLALFYGGMVRGKNVLGTIMHSFFILCIISLQWVLWGYSLSFGADIGGLIGGLDFLGLKGVGMEPNGTLPHLLFMMFQGMFAIITVALITGAFAERMKFSALVIFSVVWATVVYDPICHWVWGGGWLGDLGALDFAGGTVVHISSGISALAAALLIGKRKGYMKEPMPPHNLPMTLLGTGLLWFGWFGFNAGSALAANGLAAMAFVTTNTSAAAAGATWMFVEWAHRGKPTMLGLASGAVAGLVAITPAAGFVGPVSAIIIGIGAGIICYFMVGVVKPRLGYDDSLDVFGIHGTGGIWGALATGLFASLAINSGGADGLFFGSAQVLGKQVIAIVVSAAYSFVLTYVILKVIDLAIGIRVGAEDEAQGLDLSQHSESGYIL
ncbi:MAG: ammonium transporter [Thermodesulfobacteriota bacterium]